MQTKYKTELCDFFNAPLNTGDLVLGAIGSNKYHQTKFKIAVVVGRTAKMVKIVQLIAQQTDVSTLTPDVVCDMVFSRFVGKGRIGARFFSDELVKFKHQLINQQDIDRILLEAEEENKKHPQLSSNPFSF